MPYSQPIQFSPATSRFRVGHIAVAVIAVALGAYWIAQTVRKGAFSTDPSAVTRIVNSRPADGEGDVLPNSYISADVSAGHAIDPESIDVETVRLYRASDRRLFPAQVNTSAAGDSLVLTPLEMLEPGTRYTFEVRGVRDSTGGELLPFTMSFTTTGAGKSAAFPVAFEKLDVPGEALYYTALAIGPDRKLYSGTADGRIVRRRINSDGSLTKGETIEALMLAENGPRLITGIAFDPQSSADNLILWVSHGQLARTREGRPLHEGASEWTGKISVLSGAALSEHRDVVIGLPRSFSDHLNNQLAFGPDDAIYFSQGSHTAMGAPDKKWGGDRVERLLSAAVLRLDPKKLKGDGPLDVKTKDGGGTYDPFAAGAPLTIYASGVRVAYDILWHSNGRLYTAINGSAAGGNSPATPADRNYPHRVDYSRRGAYDGGEVLGMKNIAETQPDLLLRLEPDCYYGHPNPVRGEYVLNGGNPTADKDPFEVAAYPVGTRPDRNWRQPAYSFGTSVSPNGMIEFESRGRLFNGALDGKILITRFSGGKDIIVLSVNDSGDVTESITGIAGLTNFTDPLDLAQDPASGCIFVAEYGGAKLTLLRPIVDPARLADIPQSVFRQQIRASAD